MKTSNCLTAAVLLLSTATLEAEGIVGNDFIEATANYIDLDGFDGNGFTAVANRNYKETREYGIDLYFGGSWSSIESLDTYEVAAGGIIYFSPSSTIRPYIDLGLGYAWINGPSSADSYIWGAGVGLEIQATDKFVITPEVSYVDAPDLDSDDTNLSLKLAYWFNEKTYGTIKYTDLESGGNADAIRVGGGFRY